MVRPTGSLLLGYWMLSWAMTLQVWHVQGVPARVLWTPCILACYRHAQIPTGSQTLGVRGTQPYRLPQLAIYVPTCMLSMPPMLRCEQ